MWPEHGKRKLLGGSEGTGWLVGSLHENSEVVKDKVYLLQDLAKDHCSFCITQYGR